MFKTMNILISGAGIAGPALAYWLKSYGFQPTIVEYYPNIREGGFVIDFWGVGYDVAEKMGILDQIREASYNIRDLVFVGDYGEKEGGINLKKAIDVLDGRLLTLLRSDLSKILYNATKETVPYIFDDSITHLEQTDHGVIVTFKKRGKETFDLVVGADGLHSNVRALSFGKEEKFERFLGYYVASYTLDNFLGENFTSKYTMYSTPNKQVALYSVRANKISLFFIFKHAQIEQLAQKKLLKSIFQEEKWICSQLLARLDEAPDFYFDVVSQIVMDQWSNGRITLLGDAAYSPSLLAGQGAALAMAGAYVLAGELYQANGDYKSALQNYERIFKPFADKKQATAHTFVRSFIPPTRRKIWFRNRCSSLMNLSFFSKLYWKRFLIDPIILKNYR